MNVAFDTDSDGDMFKEDDSGGRTRGGTIY